MSKRPVLTYEAYAETRDSVKADLMYRSHRKVCICEKLRQIYDMVDMLPDGLYKQTLVELIVDAFIMGKKITHRLTHLNRFCDDGSGNKGEALKPTPHLEETRRFRASRKLKIK